MTPHIPAKVQVGRFLRTVFPAFLVVVSAVVLGLGFVVYRVTDPGKAPELVNPSSYLLPSVDVSWPLGAGGELSGWWIPGKDRSPAVILVPGRGMGRSDVLSLAAAMHGKGFHVLAFDMRSQGAEPTRRNSLGLNETADVLSAIDFALSRPNIDNTRLGIWGVDVGARAALDAATMRPEIAAIAVDSAFDTVADFFSIQLEDELGPVARFVEPAALVAFRACMLASSASVHRPLRVDRLADRSILFLQAQDRDALARTAGSLYNRMEPRKEMLSVPHGRMRLMSGDEVNNYDRQVANFFQLNLPASSGGRLNTAMSSLAK